MKFVLFLIFFETGFEPRAEYSDYQSCAAVQKEREQVAQKNAENMIVFEGYKCIAATKSYDVDD